MKFKTMIVTGIAATVITTAGAMPSILTRDASDSGVFATHTAYALDEQASAASADSAATTLSASDGAVTPTESEEEASSSEDQTADKTEESATPESDSSVPAEGVTTVEPTVSENVPTDGDKTDQADTAKDVDEDKEPVYVAPTFSFEAHVQNRGWDKTASALTPGTTVTLGTVGKSLRLEALRYTLTYPELAEGEAVPTGTLEMRAYVAGKGWLDAVSGDGAIAGTVGQSGRIEALSFALTEQLAEKYDVYYQVHVQNVGWMPWAKNGENAGYVGWGYRVEAVRVMLVEKGSEDAPATGDAFKQQKVLSGTAHVQNKGWLASVSGSDITLGTIGKALRLEALTLSVQGMDVAGGIKYSAHVQNKGWTGYASDGNLAGTVGQGLRVEAIKIELTGAVANEYDVYYRAHVQNVGWMPWTKNGEAAGTQGLALRLESVEVKLVKKGEAAPTTGASLMTGAGLSVKGYVNNSGWQGASSTTAGTTGKSLSLGGISVSATGDLRPSGSVNYRLQTTGGSWTGWSANGTTAGTANNSTAYQGVQFTVDGDLSKYYDVYYRTHLSNYGWTGWAKNGQTSGSTGFGFKIEAVDVKLVLKGSAAPGSTSKYFIDSSVITKLGWQNPSGYYQVSTKNVKLPSAATGIWSYVTPSRISVNATRAQCIEAFIQRAYEYLGTAYKWNYSCAPGVGVDCIGLVYQCAYATGMDMGEFNPWNHWATGTNGWHSHDAMNVWNYGKIQRLSFSQRERGDLIFYPGHVAIYLGNNKIIEASSISGKVVISSVYRYSTIYGVGRLYVK